MKITNNMFQAFSFVFLLSSCGTQQTLQAEDFEFRGVKLLSPPTNDMVFDLAMNRNLTHGFKKNKTYIRPQEKLNIGDIRLTEIYYSYYENKLYRIDIMVGPDDECVAAKQLAELIEYKYNISFGVVDEPLSSDYFVAIRQNKDISFSVLCTPMLGGIETTIASFSNPKTEQDASNYLDKYLEHANKLKLHGDSKDL